MVEAENGAVFRRFYEIVRDEGDLEKPAYRQLAVLVADRLPLRRRRRQE